MHDQNSAHRPSEQVTSEVKFVNFSLFMCLLSLTCLCLFLCVYRLCDVILNVMNYIDVKTWIFHDYWYPNFAFLIGILSRAVNRIHDQGATKSATGSGDALWWPMAPIFWPHRCGRKTIGDDKGKISWWYWLGATVGWELLCCQCFFQKNKSWKLFVDSFTLVVSQVGSCFQLPCWSRRLMWFIDSISEDRYRLKMIKVSVHLQTFCRQVGQEILKDLPCTVRVTWWTSSGNSMQ